MARIPSPRAPCDCEEDLIDLQARLIACISNDVAHWSPRRTKEHVVCGRGERTNTAVTKSVVPSNKNKTNCRCNVSFGLSLPITSSPALLTLQLLVENLIPSLVSYKYNSQEAGVS